MFVIVSFLQKLMITSLLLSFLKLLMLPILLFIGGARNIKSWLQQLLENWSSSQTTWSGFVCSRLLITVIWDFSTREKYCDLSQRLQDYFENKAMTRNLALVKKSGNGDYCKCTIGRVILEFLFGSTMSLAIKWFVFQKPCDFYLDTFKEFAIK